MWLVYHVNLISDVFFLKWKRFYEFPFLALKNNFLSQKFSPISPDFLVFEICQMNSLKNQYLLIISEYNEKKKVECGSHIPLSQKPHVTHWRWEWRIDYILIKFRLWISKFRRLDYWNIDPVTCLPFIFFHSKSSHFFSQH